MKVTVVMTTYNHERFLAQAVESALMQETDFEYEIVIIEDFSTDRTRAIAVELQERHHAKIRLVLPPRNCNDSRNFARSIETSTSQYIAMLEGDDYWTSPFKLQKQVGFLDAHPECTTCFHNVLQLHDDGRAVSNNPPDQKPISGMSEILASNFIATASVMFRRGLFGKFPEWFFGLPIGDWPLHIMNTRFGQIGFLPDTMGVYRIHANGLWSKRSVKEKMETVIRFYEEMNANLEYAYDDIIRVRIAQKWFELALEHETSSGDLGFARTCVAKSLRACPFGDAVPTWGRLKRWVRLYGQEWVGSGPASA